LKLSADDFSSNSRRRFSMQSNEDTLLAGALRDRSTQKMPLRTRRSFTRRTPRVLFGSIGVMAATPDR